MGKGHFLLLNTDRGEPSLLRKWFTGGQISLFFFSISHLPLLPSLGGWSIVSFLASIPASPRLSFVSSSFPEYLHCLSPTLLSSRSCRRMIQFKGLLLCQQYLAWGYLLSEMPARPTHTQGGATSHLPFTWYQMSRALWAWSCKIKYNCGLHLPGLSPDRWIYLSYLNSQA